MTGTTAVISNCGQYRYALERRWDARTPAMFIMLNPSTADATQDDPTIRRCVNFAKAWGYGGILIGNLYAWRATKPDELDQVDEPIGRQNETYLWEMRRRAGIVIAAWGAKPNRGRYKLRERAMLWWAHGIALHHLGLTRDGHPAHPLYLPKITTPTLWYDVDKSP